jgi:acyl-coenzyme A synthetase/AMP-(fatty) acid ligase
MLSLFDQGAPAPCPAPFNMAAHVLARAGELADKTALSVIGGAQPESWTYAALETAVRGTATGLLREGLMPGDIVLIRLGNTADFPIAYLGAIGAGLVPVPTSSQLTEREITAMSADLAPKLIIAAPGISLPDHSAPVLPLERLRAFRDLPPADFALGDPNRPAYIIFTSGTSGRPRAVVHAHRAIWARRMMWNGWYGLTETDFLLHAGAFNWTYTLGTGLMDPWSVGASALIPAAGIAPTELARLLAEHEATIFAAAPGVYRQMLRAPVPALPKLRHGLSAGEKLPSELARGWEKASGAPVYEAYGMSECSTFVSASPSAPAPVTTLGRPQPGRHVALIGAEGPVPMGEPGVIAVHRSDPGLMLGYLGQPEETAARFQGEWFLTGDVGRMADDFTITYEGRADDMMNAGGYRVSPVEVEDAMTAHPTITDAAACELQVKADTTVIGLFYVSSGDITEEELAAFAAERLARYKCPRLFLRRESLPRGANNKLLRRVLREEWEAASKSA